MQNKESQSSGLFQQYSWLKYLLVFLCAEKVIQHIVVTISLYLNISNVRARVVPDYNILMITGGIVAILFAVALWMLFRKTAWALKVIAFLALLDIVGEFFAQGTIAIALNVSFVTAAILLVSAIAYEKQVLSRYASRAT